MRKLATTLAVITLVAFVVSGCGARSRSTVATGSTDTSAPRFEFATYWVRGFSDPRPVDSYAYRDPSGEHPYVLFGSVTNTGGTVATNVAVESVWRDASNHVLWRAAAAIVQPSSPTASLTGPLTDRAGRLPRSAPAVDLEPGQSADLLVVVPQREAPSGIDAITPTFTGSTG
jgi:hypothetical protein